jgi:Sulfatase
MPTPLTDYHMGWSGALGFIPVNRPDMWRVFNDYYLNMIDDTDTGLQQLLNGLDELNLWGNTVVIFTADHGEMAGDHGGLRGKGPFAYEGNAHVPLIIVHPDYSVANRLRLATGPVPAERGPVDLGDGVAGACFDASAAVPARRN